MPRLTFEKEAPALQQGFGRQGMPWLRCRSGSITGLISHSAIESIHRREQWDPAPARGELAGWLRLDPQVPVYHLAALLGQPWQGGQPRSALVVRAASPAFAIGVEALSRLSLPAETHLSALPWVLRRRVRNAVAAVADTGGELAICLDARLLNPAAPAAGQRAELPSSSNPVISGPAPGSAVTPGAVGKLLAFHLPAPVADGKNPLIGLSFLQVLEVAERLPYLPLPGGAAEMPGLVWWRNHPVPFIDLTYCLGGGRTPYNGDTILVARGSKSAEAVAIPVGDEVSGMPMSVACAPCAEPFHPRIDCLRGEFDLGWERLLIPDLDSFFR